MVPPQAEDPRIRDLKCALAMSLQLRHAVHGMNPGSGCPLSRRAALLALNLLYVQVWGFASVSKLTSGIPSWFGDKFGSTFLAQVPGLKATFWLLTLSELFAFGLALLALLRLEFLRCRPPTLLKAALVWSLFVFLQLVFGQWLTNDYASAFQLFTYFGITLFSLFYTQRMTLPPSPSAPAAHPGP